ncbi:hypothetical protein LCGC14_2005460, partial [marine sediment metagenome]
MWPYISSTPRYLNSSKLQQVHPLEGLLKQLGRQDLLVLDEMGYVCVNPSPKVVRPLPSSVLMWDSTANARPS